MSAYVFVELPAPLNEWISMREARFPLRVHLAEELQRPEAPQPEQILFELERYLEAHPQELARYAEGGAQLALRTAVELFTQGLKEDSLQFYELSLRLRPDDLLTRLHYAIALHALCYRDAALEEYQRIMARTTARDNLRVWILAAQIHFHQQQYEAVVHLLEPLASEIYPQDDEFWQILGEAKSELRPPAADVMPATVATKVSCPKCNTVVRQGALFCQQCGQSMQLQSPSFCPQCGTPHQPEDRFCASCGAAHT